MNDLEARLTRAFQTVFPSLPEKQIPQASQTTVEAWDSVAALTLLNVVEEEFNLQIDLDALPELDSYQSIRQYLTEHAS